MNITNLMSNKLNGLVEILVAKRTQNRHPGDAVRVPTKVF